jgi:hypothetical protein
MIDIQDAETAVASLAAEQAAKGNSALTTLAWMCRRKTSLTLADGSELRVRTARDRNGSTRLDRARVIHVDPSGTRCHSWTVTQGGAIEEE